MSSSSRSGIPPNAPPRKIVVCPTCGGDSVYGPENACRPFCGPRCKGIDLGNWASENFRVPAEAPPEDAPFGDPRTQH